MRFLAALCVVMAAIGVAFAAYVFSGRYDVAASTPRSALSAWALEEAMEQSVRKHAAAIAVPPLQDPEQVRRGYQHYAAMCEMCHGAPGVKPSELARGLEPAPPLLHEEDEATEWNAAELFWITKHGIKLTGMPGWGATHSDEEIWAIVAFLQKLPQMSAGEYASLRTMPGEPHGHHEHGDARESDAERGDIHGDARAHTHEHSDGHAHTHSDGRP